MAERRRKREIHSGRCLFRIKSTMIIFLKKCVIRQTIGIALQFLSLQGSILPAHANNRTCILEHNLLQRYGQVYFADRRKSEYSMEIIQHSPQYRKMYEPFPKTSGYSPKTSKIILKTSKTPCFKFSSLVLGKARMNKLRQVYGKQSECWGNLYVKYYYC